MDKLTFYAMTTSEKLDRIGMYLEQRLSRDISRHRIGFVYNYKSYILLVPLSGTLKSYFTTNFFIIPSILYVEMFEIKVVYFSEY